MRKSLRGVEAILGAWVAFCMACSPVRAEDHCTLQQIAKLDMSMLRDGRTSVPMTIQGQKLNMLVGTGGWVSMLTSGTVQTLGLPPQLIRGSSISQYGGLRIDHFVTAHDVSLGGLTAGALVFLVMPERGHSADIDGVLGSDVLKHYDVEFDFANSKFGLFSRDHCEGAVVYWTKSPFGRVAFHLDESGHILVPVTLDGKEMQAIIDTGSTRTVASLDRVEGNFNLNEKSPNMTSLSEGSEDYVYPFKTLTFDDITVTNPDIVLVPDAKSKISDSRETIILGMNVLRRLHVYIAYGEHYLYVTPATAH